MAIVDNIPCPECQKNGHDSRGNHLIVFEDGAKYCGKHQYHSDGLAYYESADGSRSILDEEITGKIKYSASQFKELEKTGRLNSPALRAAALSGMRGADRWEVANEEEKARMQQEWAADEQFFNELKIKHLIDRHIHGSIAKVFNVRVGHDSNGQVNRHYYPVYEQGKWVGAKCRTLPKDFRFGTLGRMWGKVDMFGMNTVQQVMESGERKHKLLVVGGECDAMAAFQMLLESKKGTQYEGRMAHVWSPTKGESTIQQIIDNKEQINQFKEIIWAFDNDETGQQLIRECARLFPTKSFTLTYPSGCKDANDCLKKGMQKEFVDAWFNKADIGAGSKIKTVRQLSKKAKVTPKMGLSWPWPSMNRMTIGLRDHMLYLFGAGSGVGKTATTKEIVKHLIDVHGESVGVIYTEEPATTTVRSYAGKWINKRIELPPTTDSKDADYDPSRDYTEEQANQAIDELMDRDLLFIADLQGDTSIDTIMATCEEMLMMGIKNIVIDNLTGITLPHDMNKVDAIDEAMKRIGNFKDEKPVRIFLYSHLKKVPQGRTPHEEGGEVQLEDFRGSGAIKFWPNYAFGIRRNTRGETIEEKCTTYIECLKDRDQGVMTGEKVVVTGNLNTGRILEPRDHVQPTASLTCDTSTETTVADEEF